MEQMNNREFIARKIAAFFEPGDVVNLGVGIPVLASNYVKKGVWIQSENGLLGVGKLGSGVRKVESFCNAAGDEVMPVSGACTFDVAMSFGMMRTGRVSGTVLGCLQVAANGDLANWAMPGMSPGMGGAMDIVSGVENVIVATTHCAKDGSPKIVKECTLPLTGKHVVNYIVTEYCVFKVTESGLLLTELRNTITVDELKKITDAPFEISDNLIEMTVTVDDK